MTPGWYYLSLSGVQSGVSIQSEWIHVLPPVAPEAFTGSDTHHTEECVSADLSVAVSGGGGGSLSNGAAASEQAFADMRIGGGELEMSPSAPLPPMDSWLPAPKVLVGKGEQGEGVYYPLDAPFDHDIQSSLTNMAQAEETLGHKMDTDAANIQIGSQMKTAVKTQGKSANKVVAKQQLSEMAQLRENMMSNWGLKK